MTFRKFIRFILKTVITGLAVAFLYVLVIQPELLHDKSNVVEFRESKSSCNGAVNSLICFVTHF